MKGGRDTQRVVLQPVLALGAALGLAYLLAVGSLCQVRSLRGWLPGMLSEACRGVLP